MANPIDVLENLFFAIFGQKDTDDFMFSQGQQPTWTIYLFKVIRFVIFVLAAWGAAKSFSLLTLLMLTKNVHRRGYERTVSFSLYMLVSVIVLINLLIAMMSDTYQSIQSQSDIEWKYGLSKLIRNMQKTRTAPSPLNLITTWVTYLWRICKKRGGKRKSMSVMQGFVGSQTARKSLGRDKLLSVEGQKPVVGFSRLQHSPVGSQLSFRTMPGIDTVVDWDVVRKKYRMRFGDLVEKPSSEIDGMNAGEIM